MTGQNLLKAMTDYKQNKTIKHIQVTSRPRVNGGSLELRPRPHRQGPSKCLAGNAGRPIVTLHFSQSGSTKDFKSFQQFLFTATISFIDSAFDEASASLFRSAAVD
eukprot:g65531.t1